MKNARFWEVGGHFRRYLVPHVPHVLSLAANIAFGMAYL